jgi:tRNA pseudouridine55 synthase
MATGLLVLCLGVATRLVEYMSDDKRYAGEIALGATTTTDDADGEVLATRAVPAVSESELRSLAARFTGAIQQVPPRYSAVKRNGVRSYAIARAGGDPGLAPRTVHVRRLSVQRAGTRRIGMDVECGAGTYVRSLARDMGEALGCGGHLSSLRRTGAGSFHVGDAWTMAEIEALASGGLLARALLAPEEGIAGVEAALVAGVSAAALRQGKALTCDGCERYPVRVYDAAGEFVGIGRIREGELRPVKVFPNSDTFDSEASASIIPVDR